LSDVNSLGTFSLSALLIFYFLLYLIFYEVLKGSFASSFLGNINGLNTFGALSIVLYSESGFFSISIPD